jgi:hypothetical protein
MIKGDSPDEWLDQLGLPNGGWYINSDVSLSSIPNKEALVNESPGPAD